jgi:thiosulfate/3-mercaptopyruvate sulfurtransferase
VEKLKVRAQSLSRSTSIVIYCGCCPWVHCPNIHPAYDELKKMGFTKLRVLYLQTGFGANWAEKGYPVEKGS